MYTWQDIARRTEIVYDEQTLVGRKLRSDVPINPTENKIFGDSIPPPRDSISTLRRRKLHEDNSPKETNPPLSSKLTQNQVRVNEYGILVENLKNCYACGPFVGKFLVVGVLLDYIYLKFLDWMYPVELIDIAPDIT